MQYTAARPARPHRHPAQGGIRLGRRGRVLALLAVFLLAGSAQSVPATPNDVPRPGTGARVGTWASTPTATPAGDGTVFENQTIRQLVHTSVAGTSVRIRLSNEFGGRPLVIGAAHVALRADGAADTRIAPATDRRLTFGGRSAVTVPAGSPAISDPVRLRLPAGADLVVSIFLPQRTPGTTVHAFARQENAVAAGDVTGATDIRATATTNRWYFLSGVSVTTRSRHRAGAVVALGDSITDGAQTTVGADHRWPDLFARRLRHTPDLRRLGVLNQGISGNRLLHDPNPPAGSDAEAFAAWFGQSALRRFDRDVAAQPGARYVIALLGVNDLGHPGTVAPESERVSAEDLIAGHRQLIARAHERGLTIYGGTLTPFKGDTFGFYSPENEAARQVVNRWIRTSGAYDGVIDFDRALRDPAEPERLLPRYDSGDGLHPSDAGARAMARAVPLHLLR